MPDAVMWSAIGNGPIKSNVMWVGVFRHGIRTKCKDYVGCPVYVVN